MSRPLLYGPNDEPVNEAPHCGFIEPETKASTSVKPAPAPIPPPRDLPRRMHGSYRGSLVSLTIPRRD